MSSAAEILAGILLGVVAGVVTTLLQLAWARWVTRGIARAIWQLGGPATALTIYPSHSEVFDREDALRAMPRYAIGMGPVRALVTIAPSLIRGYPGIDFSSIPIDDAHVSLGGDTLFLGGVKRNRRTHEALARLASDAHLPPGTALFEMTTVEGEDLILVTEAGVRHAYKPVQIADHHFADFGIVIRDQNPVNRNRVWIVLAGCSPWGTIGAAKWLTEEGKTWTGSTGRQIRSKKPLRLVVKVEVRNNRIESIREARHEDAAARTVIP